MSEDTNRVILIGRLTKDIDLSYTQSGFAIGKISLAVNRSVKKDDKYIDEVSYFDIVILGKRAEGLSKYLIKGQQVSVDGSLKQDRWEKDGQKHSKIVINCDNIQLLGSKNNTQDGPYSEANADQKFEDDIPF